MQDIFIKRKHDILSKQDKSSKHSWDMKIKKLCEKINKLKNYYTTSSCSGRIILIIESDKKEHGLFVKVYHDLLNFEGLKKDLNKIALPFSCPHSLLNDKILSCKHSGSEFNKNLLIKSYNNDIKKNIISFKQEPCGLHVSCKTLKDSQNFLNKAKLAGWKKSGIIASNKRFIVECFSTEKLEFPIIKNGKILVNDDFLKLIVKKSNENLEKSWKKINRLEKLI